MTIHVGVQTRWRPNDRAPGSPSPIGQYSTHLYHYSPNAKDNFEFELKICGWRGDAVLDLRRKR
jgi:hypothetical protein